MLEFSQPDSVRFLRYFYSAVLVIVVLLALGGEFLPPARAAAPAVLVYVLYAVGAGDVLAAVVLRRKFSGRAQEVLRVNPGDAGALADWMKGQMVPLPMALGVGVMGFACRALGSPALRAAPFYGAAVILLVVLRPADLPF